MPEISQRDISEFTGRLLTLVETWDVPNAMQLKARKDTVKALVRDYFHEEDFAFPKPMPEA